MKRYIYHYMGYCSTCGPKPQQPKKQINKEILSKIEEQADYQFVQRVIQELTQSCAINLPIPPASIYALVLQAAQYFWENYDLACESRYYCLPYEKISKKCGPNNLFRLPDRIMSVYGVYKTNDVFNYGVLGDFSLERMVLNNSIMASGSGGSLGNMTFGSVDGWNLVDVMGALYEVQTYKALFQAPLTYDFNMYSHILNIEGDYHGENIILETYIRCKIQDLYSNYYFFRFVVCLGLRSLATIMGTFEFKLPGGVTLNYSRFQDMAQTEMQEIKEWLNSQRTASYFLNSNTI